jgi:hypothetical protein
MGTGAGKARVSSWTGSPASLIIHRCSEPFNAVNRVSRQGEGIEDADTIEGAREIAQGQPTSRYDVDKIRADPSPSGHNSRSWGRLIRRPDGRVKERLGGLPLWPHFLTHTR